MDDHVKIFDGLPTIEKLRILQKEKKAALRKAVQKQKDFINKHTG